MNSTEQNAIDLNKKRDEENKRRPEMLFHYVKSPQFRTIHVDGAFGGMTPSVDRIVHVAVFSERTSIPDTDFHAIGDDGAVSAKATRRVNSRPGIIREVEVNMIMTLSSAKTLHAWLGGVIAAGENLEEAGMRITHDGTVLPPKKSGN